MNITPVQIVLWLARHSADGPKIVAQAQALMGAADLTSHWIAFKALGDTVVPDLADFPASTVTVAAEEHAQTSEELRRGFNFNPQNWAALLDFLAKVLPMFFRPTPAPAGG